MPTHTGVQEQRSCEKEMVGGPNIKFNFLLETITSYR